MKPLTVIFFICANVAFGQHHEGPRSSFMAPQSIERGFAPLRSYFEKDSSPSPSYQSGNSDYYNGVQYDGGNPNYGGSSFQSQAKQAPQYVYMGSSQGDQSQLPDAISNYLASVSKQAGQSDEYRQGPQTFVGPQIPNPSQFQAPQQYQFQPPPQFQQSAQYQVSQQYQAPVQYQSAQYDAMPQDYPAQPQYQSQAQPQYQSQPQYQPQAQTQYQPQPQALPLTQTNLPPITKSTGGQKYTVGSLKDFENEFDFEGFAGGQGGGFGGSTGSFGGHSFGGSSFGGGSFGGNSFGGFGGGKFASSTGGHKFGSSKFPRSSSLKLSKVAPSSSMRHHYDSPPQHYIISTKQ